MSDTLARIAALPCWQGDVEIEPLQGGITNANFLVRDRGRRFVARLGDDIAVHGIRRTNERLVALAAHAAGLAPAIVHSEDGALVMDFVDGETLTPEGLRKEGELGRIAPLIQRIHRDVARHLDGSAVMFCPFQVARRYITILARDSSGWAAEIPRLSKFNDELEEAVSPVDRALCHNDLLAANVIDDGKRLWLLDWEYAGFNDPLFDLANLASNNEFDPAAEESLLSIYFGAPPDRNMRHRFGAMKCASLMRETLWSMAAEIHSEIDFDYATYTQDNLDRFGTALDAYRALRP